MKSREQRAYIEHLEWSVDRALDALRKGNLVLAERLLTEALIYPPSGS